MQDIGEGPARGPGDTPGNPTPTQVKTESGWLIGGLLELLGTFFSFAYYPNNLKPNFFLSLDLLFWLCRDSVWTPFKKFTIIQAAWRSLRETTAFVRDVDLPGANLTGDVKLWKPYLARQDGLDYVWIIGAPWAMFRTAELQQQIMDRKDRLAVARQKVSQSNNLKAPKVS